MQTLEPSELFPEVRNLYEFPSVHADMLMDETRVDCYSRAIGECVSEGDVVVDIGTGTGLLAFMCLDAGASKVYAIERSRAIKWARLLAEAHGYADRMVFVEEDSRNVELPEKADVIVSELIGHIAFEEGMVESLFHARDHFLRAGGKIIPRRVDLFGALVSEQEIYPAYIDCWKTIGGIDYSVLRDEAVKACYLTCFTDRDLLSSPVTFFAVDFATGDRPILEAVMTLTADRAGIVNGLAAWFNAILSGGVTLSSGPWTRTHWRQCFVPLREPFNVHRGEQVEVKIRMALRETPESTFDLTVDMGRVD